MHDGSRDLSLDILIIEDDDDARASLQDILEMVGHNVSSASCGRDAFANTDALAATDVVIMDRQLPDGMAENLLPQLLQSAPQVDVIIVTGYADLDGTIAALRGGVADYIIKPINPDSLLDRLQRLAEHRQTELELREERHFARTILETAEAIVLVLDSEGRIRRFNRYFAKLVGYSQEEVAGADWFDQFIPDRDRDHVRQVFSQTIDNIRTSGVINPIRTKSGSERDIRWSNTTMRDENGGVMGVLAVGQDVTDLLHAQNDLLQAERLATIGQTMTGLAHESRNALQRLQNGVELLRDDLSHDKSAMRDLDKIERASNDLRDLLEEVRSYAAPIRLDLSVVSPTDIWRRAWADIEGRRAGRKVEFIETGRIADPVALDERRINQVFVNIFENALDACSDPVQIRVGITNGDDDFVVISIEDNGPGIPSESASQVFDAFFTTKATGTGLGLAIVYRIVAAHGGELSVVNTDNGTRFVIRLPRTDSAGPDNMENPLR